MLKDKAFLDHFHAIIREIASSVELTGSHVRLFEVFSVNHNGQKQPPFEVTNRNIVRYPDLIWFLLGIKVLVEVVLSKKGDIGDFAALILWFLVANPKL